MMAAAIRVLYVDDEPDLLEICKLFLEGSGDFSVATIESAPAALELLKTEKFDAIISDYQMPGMDGIQFLVEVRKTLGKIPFILFTGRGREEIVIQAINNGADFYLQKGGEPGAQFAELTHKIRTAVERRTADKAFNESENRYHSLVDTMHDCVAVYRAVADGEDFVFLEFNKAAEKAESISREEVIGRRVTEVFPGVREFGLLDVFRRVWRTGIPEMFPVSLYKDNRISGWRDSFIYKLPTGEIVADYSDETTKKLAEEALKKSEEKSRLTLDAINDGIWDWNIPTGTAFFSPRWYTMIGYEPGELPAMFDTWRSLLHPDDLNTVEQKIQDHIGRKDEGYKVEFRMRTKQGGWKWILARGKVVERDEAGSPVRMMGTHTDIDERKKAEKEIKDSRNFLTSIIEQSPNPMWISDEKGTLIQLNKACCDLLQITPEEVVGKYNLFEDTIVEEQGKMPLVRSVFNEGKSVTFDLSYNSSQLKSMVLERSTFVFLQVTMFPIRDSTGKITNAVIEEINITERIRAEEEIAFKNVVLSTQQETSLDSILVVDENGKILSFNRRFIKLWGIPEEIIATGSDELALKSVLEKLTDPEAFLARINYLYAHTEEKSHEEIQLKDGRVLDRYSAPMSGENKRYYGRVWYFRDITEQRQAEEGIKDAKDYAEKLIQTANAMIVGLDSNGEIITFNQAAEQITGYTAADMTGRNWFEVIVPKERFPQVWEEFNRLLAGGLPEHFENPILTKSGEERYIVWKNSEIRDKEKIIGIIGFGIDITDRKRAESALELKNQELMESYEQLTASEEELHHNFEELARQELALRKSEERYRAVADFTYDWEYWICPDGKFIYVSQSCERITGYRPEEFTLDPNLLITITHPDDRAGIIDHLAIVKNRSEEHGVIEFRIISKNGEERWIGHECQPIYNTNREYLGNRGSNRDITGRKRVELELERKNQELWASYEQLTSSEEELRARLGDLIWQEQALKESEDRFRGIFDTITSGVAIYEVKNDGASGKDYIIKNFNKTALAMEGKKKEEVTGKSLFDLRPAIDEYGLIPVFQQVWKSGVPGYFPQKVYIDEKYSSWYENRVFRLQSGEIVAVYDDITGRKRAELELVSAHEKLKEAHRLAHIGTWDWVIENDTVTWSEELCNIAGWDPSLPAPTYAEHPRIYTPASWDRLSDAVTRALTTGEPYNLELELVRPDGSIRWTNTFGGVKRELNGKIIGLYGTVQDITESKRAEEELEKGRRFIEHTLSTTPALIYIYDVVEQRNVYTNRGILEALGYTPEEISAMGQDLFSKILHPEDAGPVGQHHARFSSLPDSTIAEIEYRMKHADGSWRWLHSRDVVFQRTPDGAVKQILGSSIDITESKRAKEALRQANKKLTLLSGITRNDINNQMIALRGYTTLLQRKQPDRSFAEYFQKIDAAAERISAMIQFTKMYDSIGVNATVWQNAASLVDAAAKDVALGHVRLENDLPAGAEVFAEPLIARVFYNLLDNAVRHGDTITTIRFSVVDRDRDRLIICKDDGVGVPAEEKEKIFERGFGKNTGLGLFLSREILDITGITIHETGEPGKGARFEMHIPASGYRMNPVAYTKNAGEP